MSPDLQTLLRDAAPEPTIQLDETRLVDRALRQRRLVRAGTAAAVAIAVVAAAVLGLQAFRNPGDLEIVDQPGEPAPSGWQTLQVGSATFAVPGDWPVQRIEGPEDPMPCPDMLEITERRVYLADRLYLPSCAPGPSGDSPQQGQVTVYAYPAAQMSPHDRDGLINSGQHVNLAGAQAWMDDGDSYRTYLFDELNAVLLIAYQPDPQLADRILNTVHRTRESPDTPRDEDDVPDTTVRPCTAAGCFSGVEFDISVLQDQEQPVTIQACVNDICKTATYPAEEDLPQQFFVELEEVDANAIVEARLVATGPDGQVVAEQSWERVPLDERLQPNGPKCPPTCWVGRVRIQSS